MPAVTLAECIINLKELITTLDTQVEYHNLTKAILSLMLRTDALYIPKNKLYSLFLGLNEQIIYANKFGENALDLAIKTTRQLIIIDGGNSAPGSDVTRH